MDAELETVEDRTKRHSFSLKLKIDILREYEAGVKGKGFYALAKKYNVATSTIRGWHAKKETILRYLLDPEISTKVARRVKGGGRKHKYDELEIVLVAWVKVFECIQKAKNDVYEFDQFIAGYVDKVVCILEARFSDVLDGEDKIAIKKGVASGSEAELVAVADIESWRIVRTELNEDCSLHNEIVFGEENSLKTVHLIKLGEFYGLKM
jgi:hypothetical protein